MTTRAIEYRLSWESPTDVWQIDALEQVYGKNVWPTYNWDTLGEWKRTEVIWRDNEEKDHLDQHETLKKWAETREQPIRNVKLEWRPIDIGEWEPVNG